MSTFSSFSLFDSNISRDDDEEETTAGQPPEAPKEATGGGDEGREEADGEGEGEGEGEPSVKPEPGTKPTKPKSEELKIYTNNELSKMRMDVVMADLAFAEGQISYIALKASVLTRPLQNN